MVTCSLSSWFVWVLDRCLNSWVRRKQCFTCSGDTKSSATLMQLYKLWTWSKPYSISKKKKKQPKHLQTHVKFFCIDSSEKLTVTYFHTELYVKHRKQSKWPDISAALLSSLIYYYMLLFPEVILFWSPQFFRILFPRLKIYNTNAFQPFILSIFFPNSITPL